MPAGLSGLESVTAYGRVGPIGSNRQAPAYITVSVGPLGSSGVAI